MKNRTPEEQAAFKARRKASYAMPKCACGAIAGIGQIQCGRCRDLEANAYGAGQRIDELEATVERLSGNSDTLDAMRYRAIKDAYKSNSEIKFHKGTFAVVKRFTSYEYEAYKTLDAAIDAFAKEAADRRNDPPAELPCE
jgi:hypothetical protein